MCPAFAHCREMAAFVLASPGQIRHGNQPRIPLKNRGTCAWRHREAARLPPPRSLSAWRGCAAPPADYDGLRMEALEATRRALRAGVRLLEVQFPAVPNMATAALNEVLDANRDFSCAFARALAPRYAAGRLDVVLPDVDEARLAARVWGDVPFGVRALPRKGGKEAPPPSYVTGDGDGLVVVVSPGFNVSEWISMEPLECDGGDPIVLINGDLEKVRGGYYPRLFYPGLHGVKDRFLSRFEEVYYLKMFSNGGTLMRRYPEDWKLLYRSPNSNAFETLKTYSKRPPFREVEEELRKARTQDLLKR